MRPIGIGDVLRRIVSNATMALLKPDIVAATAPLQTCAGLRGGIEASIHAMRQMYEDHETEGVLFVDASNAFNALNRKAALHNVQYTCPALSTFVKNLYQCDAELFLPNSDQVIHSREGTTQGGPESMGLYAVSTSTLSDTAGESCAKSIFYADDGSGAGTLEQLKKWWENLQVHGPLVGYFPNAPKTWLVVKPGHEERANELFPDINVTSEGHKFLGSFIGTPEATSLFVKEEVDAWEKDIRALANIAKKEPQLAYTAYVYGTSQRWKFLCRTTPGIAETIKHLESVIRNTLIPALFGSRQATDWLRGILKLPARLGGMGLTDPSEEAEFELENSQLITAQLTEAIFNQEQSFEINDEVQKEAMKTVRKRKEVFHKERQQLVLANLGDEMKRLVLLSSEKGSSAWLTSIPLKSHAFRLNKQEFFDAIAMRYNLALKDVPQFCSCGESYSINHCLTCKLGGYIHIRHNTVRDTFGDLLKEICKDVKLEPQLLPITGEILPAGTNVADNARADVSAVGLWQPLSRAFLDIRIFNPFAPTNAAKDIAQMYSHHEKSKKREYSARILEVEKGTFSPVIFGCHGGASQETIKLMKVIAMRIATKRKEEYSTVMNFVRRRVSFDIVKTCVLSLRGSRGKTPASTAVGELDLGLREMNTY